MSKRRSLALPRQRDLDLPRLHGALQLERGEGDSLVLPAPEPHGRPHDRRLHADAQSRDGLHRRQRCTKVNSGSCKRISVKYLGKGLVNGRVVSVTTSKALQLRIRWIRSSVTFGRIDKYL